MKTGTSSISLFDTGYNSLLQHAGITDSINTKRRKLNLFGIYPVLAASILLILFSSCNKETDEIRVPLVTTAPIYNISESTASCGGEIIRDGGAEITAKGICWSEFVSPTVDDNVNAQGTGSESFTGSITDLTAGTVYYVRAWATNKAGTGYGHYGRFATLPDVTYGSVSDIEGNSYKTIQIGSQTWMAENLRTSHYNDGTPIPFPTSWDDSTPAWCWYENDSVSFKETYGALYNRHAFDTVWNEGKHVCPSGWHVPGSSEWEELQDYMGGSAIAGAKLKESGNAHWSCANTTATNAAGFSALPGGMRNGDEFWGEGEVAYWWSYAYDITEPALLKVSCDRGDLEMLVAGIRLNTGTAGLSIRCVKD